MRCTEIERVQVGSTRANRLRKRSGSDTTECTGCLLTFAAPDSLPCFCESAAEMSSAGALAHQPVLPPPPLWIAALRKASSSVPVPSRSKSPCSRCAATPMSARVVKSPQLSSVLRELAL